MGIYFPFMKFKRYLVRGWYFPVLMKINYQQTRYSFRVEWSQRQPRKGQETISLMVSELGIQIRWNEVNSSGSYDQAIAWTNSKLLSLGPLFHNKAIQKYNMTIPSKLIQLSRKGLCSHLIRCFWYCPTCHYHCQFVTGVILVFL